MNSWYDLTIELVHTMKHSLPKIQMVTGTPKSARGVKSLIPAPASGSLSLRLECKQPSLSSIELLGRYY